MTQRSVPKTDTISYLAQGREWINTAWLSASILWLCHQAAGLGGITACMAILILLSFLMLFKVADGFSSPVLASLCFLLAVFPASVRFLVRPEVFTFFFAATYLLLFQKYEQGERKALIPIPFIQLS